MTESNIKYVGKVVQVCVQPFDFPDGSRAEMEVVRHPGGAAIVALNSADEVCLLRQYRHVFGAWVWELPAGKRDRNEAPLVTAQRELAEEAGLAAREWQVLGEMWSSPGVFDEVVHLYLARELTQVPSDTEAHELVEVHWLPLTQALALARTPEMVDAKTVMGLFRAAARTAVS